MNCPQAASGFILIGLTVLASCAPQQARDPRSTSNVEAESASGWLRIISPEPAGFVSSKTVSVQARLKLSNPELRHVEVNGKNEVIRNGRISTTVELGDCDEVQSIVVWVPDTDLVANVDFYCDPERPIIHFEAPYENGIGFLNTQRPRWTIKGRVEDDNLQKLEIEDPTVPTYNAKKFKRQVRVDPIDGSFEITEAVVPGAQRRRLCATDYAGNMMCRHLAAIVGDLIETNAGVEVPDAVGIAIGQGAAEEIEKYGEKLLGARNFTDKLVDLNPLALVYDSSGKIFYEVNGLRTEHSGVADMTVELRQGEIYIHTQFYNYRSYFVFSSDYVASDVGTLFFPVLTVTFHARPKVVNGKVVVDLPRPEVSVCPNLSDCTLTMSNSFYNQVAQLTAIKQKVRATTIATIQTEAHKDTNFAIQDALDTELAYDFTLAGKRGRITATPVSIELNAGSIEVYADVGLRALDPVLHGPGSVIQRRKGRPNLGYSGNVSAALSTDLVNAAFYAAWSTGIFRQGMDAPPLEDGSELNVGFLQAVLPIPEEADINAGVRFETDAPLPPTLRETGAGSVELLVPDLRVRGYAKQEGDDPLLFEVSLAVRTEIALEGYGRRFEVKLVYFEVVGDPIGAPPTFPSGNDLDKILDLFLGDTVQEVVEGVGAIEVPAMPLFRIDDLHPIAADNYIAFEGNLYYDN